MSTSDPGNPRETSLGTVTISPGEGELAEYDVDLEIDGEFTKDALTLDAASPEDACRVAEEYITAKTFGRANVVAKEARLTGNPASSVPHRETARIYT